MDLVPILGSRNIFAGFTAATGGAQANFDVSSWEFRDAYEPIGMPQEVPDPGALGLLGRGALGIFSVFGMSGRRRR